MLAKRIIPCLDVDLGASEGRVVKGIRFKQIRYAGDPVKLAREYDEQGADEIVFLDITASHEKRETMVHVVERTAEEVFIPLCVGGGIKTVDDFNKILRAGADKIAINTAAIENPELVRDAAKVFGSQCIVVAIDAKRSNGSWEVYTYGGRKPMRIDALAWAKKVEELGAGEILLTSMDRDGTKLGFDLGLTKAVNELVSIPVIASGGVGTKEHFLEVFKETGVSAALAASVFHFGEFSVKEVKEYLKDNQINVRSV